MSKPKLSTIALGFLLFLFFLVLQFPYQNLKGYIFGKIYKTTHVLVVANDIYPSLLGWPGLGITDVDVSLPVGTGELELSAKKLIFRLGLGSFFPPAPSVSLSLKGLKKGGDLYLKVSDSKSGTKAAAAADEVQLEQIVFSALPGPLRGKLSLDGKFYVDKSDLSKSTGDADLAIEKLKIPAQNLQGFVLPALEMGTLKSKIKIKNGMADIQTLQFGGQNADLSGSVSGDVRLGHDLMDSFLNITLRLQLSDNYRKNPQASTLVSLLDSFRGKKEGNYAMKWSASLREMSTNLMSAIPQKVAD